MGVQLYFNSKQSITYRHKKCSFLVRVRVADGATIKWRNSKDDSKKTLNNARATTEQLTYNYSFPNTLKKAYLNLFVERKIYRAYVVRFQSTHCVFSRHVGKAATEENDDYTYCYVAILVILVVFFEGVCVKHQHKFTYKLYISSVAQTSLTRLLQASCERFVTL